MFRSQRMYWVDVVVPEQDIVDVTDALAASDTLHIADTSQSVAATETTEPSPWPEKMRHCLALEQRLTDLMASLDLAVEACQDETLHWIDLDLAERDVESLEREAREPIHHLNEAREKLSQLETALDQLTPLAGIDVPLQAFRDARYIFAMFGSMPTENVSRMRTSLEQIPSALLVFGERGHLTTVGLFGQMRDAEILRRAARSAYLTPIQVPAEYRGTPQEAIQSLTASIQRTRERLEAYQGELHLLQETRVRRMRHLLWRLRVTKHLIDTIGGFQKFRYTYLVTGWVPESKVEAVKQCVSAASEHAVTKVRSVKGAEGQRAPYFFSNPPIFRAFEQLVTTYSLPAYDELDPTPLLAFTFPLVFGVMFGDVGHGLLLLLVGLLLVSRRVKALAGLASLGTIATTCGLAAMLFGALYGSLFGFEEVILASAQRSCCPCRP